MLPGSDHFEFYLSFIFIGTIPNPDKQDKCVNEVIFCQKSSENNF